MSVSSGPVLIVESNVDLRDGVALMLEQAGFGVVGVDDVPTALDYVRVHHDGDKPCLILCGTTVAPDTVAKMRQDGAGHENIPVAAWRRGFPTPEELVGFVLQACAPARDSR